MHLKKNMLFEFSLVMLMCSTFIELLAKLVDEEFEAKLLVVELEFESK